jgi:hypothetical protein
MKPRHPSFSGKMTNLPRRLRRSLALSSLLLLPVWCPAAPATAAASYGDTVKQDFGNSVGLFLAGNSAAGEQALIHSNLAKPGTAAWQLESGRRLYGMALYLRANASEGMAVDAANRAVAQLTLAITKARATNDTNYQAMAFEAIGVIQDQIFHQGSTALTSYTEAVRLDPHRTHAAEEAQRLGNIAGATARQKGGK